MWRRTTSLLPRICQNVSTESLSQINTLHTSQYLKDTPRVDASKSVQDTRTKGPIKFTASDAYLNYKAVRNFYGDDRDLPASHNYVLAGTGIFGFFYLFYLRDHVDSDGGAALLKPLHETVPELAIPLLESAIAENKKFGNDTRKLERKLAEYMKEPDKHGGTVKRKLIEN